MAIRTGTTRTPDPTALIEDRIAAAAAEVIARRTGASTPAGHLTERGYWYPDPSEHLACCDQHPPTTTYPRATLAHCRGLQHVAALYNIESNATGTLRRHIRTIEASDVR
jgi:hypothetical protein